MQIHPQGTAPGRTTARSLARATLLVLIGLGTAAACAQGRQSPIDIVPNETIGAPLPELVADYRVADVSVVNTFDPAADPFVPKEFATLRVNVPAGSSVRVDHAVYDLVQFHFHTPSEHTVRGRHAPMEVHFVHLKRGACIGDRDALLVVGARIVAGREHHELDRIFRLDLPRDAAAASQTVARFDVSAVLPRFDRSWQYAGSLTAPANVGCNNPAGSLVQQLESDAFPENVTWVVLSRELQMSKRQIRTFQALFDLEGNSRLPQPLNGRAVLRDQRH